MVVAIIQARMGSTRLPGKVLKHVVGKPLLQHQIDRIKRAREIDSILVATSNKTSDDRIAELVTSLNVGCYRGSENNVLDRYYKSSTKSGANVIVRLTGDCPLADPKLIDNVVRYFKKGHFDYVSCGIYSTFPDGMDVEVMSKEVLDTVWRKAKSKYDKEHVTAYILNHQYDFKIGIYRGKEDYSHLRLTVDVKEDFKLIKKIISALYPKSPNFSLADIVSYLTKNPNLSKINSKHAKSGKKITIGKINGKTIFLRDISIEDVTADYCDWLNDQQVNKYLETKNMTTAKLRAYVKEKIKNPRVIFLVIFDKRRNKHIGNVKLEPIDFVAETAELGILIGDKTFWGRGIATEVINLICDWAFKTLVLKSIKLGVYRANKSAIKAYEKADFKFFANKVGVDGIEMIRINSID